ncbi:hypothetical protein JL720_14257 [Aureococcus anophagefferens]|nr:hypothetical protein JL720_14257 [Aureococcus anophagefferens]
MSTKQLKHMLQVFAAASSCSRDFDTCSTGVGRVGGGLLRREDFLNLALDKAETKVLRSPDDDGDGKADGVTDLLALESVSCGGRQSRPEGQARQRAGAAGGVAVDLAALAKHLNDRIAFYAELEARAADPDGYEAAKLLHDATADCEASPSREAELWVGPVSELELEEGRGAAPPPPSASPKKAARRASYGHVDWAAPGAQADAHKLRDFERSIARFFSPEEWLAELDPVLVKSGGELEREAAFEAERTRRLSDAHPLARPHVGVAYSGLMGDLKVNDLPEIDDALYLKHEHEYKPSEEEPFDDKYPSTAGAATAIEAAARAHDMCGPDVSSAQQRVAAAL